jgi:hypothetical protein
LDGDVDGLGWRPNLGELLDESGDGQVVRAVERPRRGVYRRHESAHQSAVQPGFSLDIGYGQPVATAADR